jgi:hypothetical protein
MDSRRVPALIALVGVIVAVGLFLVLKDDTADEDSTVATTTSAATTDEGPTDGAGNQQEPEKKPKPEKPEVPVVEIRGGKPVGGVQELEFKSGEEARFEVVADAADELHFHGYDLYIDVTPGKPAEVRFDADIEGLFELESHSTGELMAEISVVP